MDCHCRYGWICEAHPQQPYPHVDDGRECPGPGRQCDNPDCPFWADDELLALNPPGWISLQRVE